MRSKVLVTDFVFRDLDIEREILDPLGVDLVLPDFEYLRANADRIVGCIATHGHEDHTGGLSFLLRDLSFPIYGSALTLGLANSRIEEGGLLGRTELVSAANQGSLLGAQATGLRLEMPDRS